VDRFLPQTRNRVKGRFENLESCQSEVQRLEWESGLLVEISVINANRSLPSEFRGVNVKVVRFLEFQMGPCLQEIQELWVTDHQVVARMKNGDRS